MKNLFGKRHPTAIHVFKTPLSDVMKAPGERGRSIPCVIEESIHVLEQHGLNQEGLFRKSASTTEIDRLKRLYDENTNEEQRKKALQGSDPHTVACLLKLFLRELPDPLMTEALYKVFVSAGANDDHDERITLLKFLIRTLPELNRTILRFLFVFLKKVSDREEETKMSPENLAIVFGPTLLRTSDTSRILTDSQNVINVILSLFLAFDAIFADTTGTTPTRKIPQLSPYQPAAPVNISTTSGNVVPPISPISTITQPLITTPTPTTTTSEMKENRSESAENRRGSKRRKTDEEGGEIEINPEVEIEVKEEEESFAVNSTLDISVIESNDNKQQQQQQQEEEEEREQIVLAEQNLTLEQWTVIKDAFKQRVIELDKKRHFGQGSLTSEEIKEMKHSQIQYKIASDKVHQIQSQKKKQQANIPALVPPYSEMSIEQLREEVRALEKEKKSLGRKLTKWNQQFECLNHRKAVTAKDRQPVVSDFKRYREIRSVIETINLNLQSI